MCRCIHKNYMIVISWTTATRLSIQKFLANNPPDVVSINAITSCLGNPHCLLAFTTTMARNKHIKTMVQVLDENFLLSGTGSSTGSESGRAENTEIDQSGHSSQEGDGEDDDDEEEDDNKEEDVVVMPSPPPTVTKKRRRGLKKDK